MAEYIISKINVDGTDFKIKAEESKTADVAKKTQGTLYIGERQYDGSEDVTVPCYKGEVD